MATPLSDLQANPSDKDIFIIGGGIVGTALAYYLNESSSENRIVVLEKSLGPIIGSTGYAPGLVGQLNESAVETTLAKDSVREYVPIPDAFNRVGCLELATTESGVELLKKRCHLAHVADLPAEIITAERAASLAPDFVKTEMVKSALHFPSDGTANPRAITTFFRGAAVAKGAVFVEANVKEFEMDGDSIKVISTTDGPINAQSNRVILTAGVWTQYLLKDISSQKPITKSPIPIIPIAHPYTFTHPRPIREGPPYPFVRWPEQHVYARDHGTRDGLGSYAHTTLPMSQGFNSAVGAWPASFENVLADAAETCLKNADKFLTKGGSADENTSAAQKNPYNGIFAVTPDNLPMAGKVQDTTNLWLCAAVWITHAAGTAKLLTREILRGQGEQRSAEDEVLLKALDPNRFLGMDGEDLTRKALGRYNDIYNSQPLEK
ncbi:hypothetical protein FQN52_001740 [Onygenales sp. PD_12]|nr:hypothetical protein FQN52_001740 [Onygenales sp. PD_12]